MRQSLSIIVTFAMLLTFGCSGKSQRVTIVQSPPAQGESLYIANRAPLATSPLVKLPIGSIEPEGWLRQMLTLEAQGMAGRLPELSRWCNMEGNSWADPKGAGHSGWEEMPYWLKGYGDLGHVLKNPEIQRATRKWIDAILATQREDGWFGPRELLTSLDKDKDGTGGKPDFWPNMLVLNIVQSYHEATGDQRIIPFMTRYFRWQLNFPEKDFIVGYWPDLRAGDNLESVYWLYNRTGDKWLLDLAHKIHRCTARWDQDVVNWHGVNITQGFREPAIYAMQSRDPKNTRAAYRNYDKVMSLYGQMPGGMFGADENARKGYDDPRQGAETCSMVEFMHSFEMLTKITGDPLWADRCEEVAFNSFPASMTPDQKALHYLTSANQPQLDRQSKAPGIQNGGDMFSYSAFEKYRCCQHNVAHGWPYYAQELWLATLDKGLCASLYAASTVTARVGKAGQMIRITQETDYPYSDQVNLKVWTAKPARFPLYLRIPRWCDNASASINGQAVDAKPTPLSYIRIGRNWADGDSIVLKLPMRLSVRTWAKNKNAVSVDYGPLTFSLKIGEEWKSYGNRHKDFPEWEVLPSTPWNYGLVIDEKNPTAGFEVIRKPGPLAPQPFTHQTNPIEIKAKARKIPQWTLDRNGLVNVLQQSPAKTTEPVETVTLIPMGAARLRISAFPVVSDSASAHEWKVPVSARSHPASHCFEGDSTAALDDGIVPASSGDRDIPRFTWWNHKGTTEWVQYDFDKPRTVKAVEVYWFDDTGTGHCRVPASWQVLYKDGEQWKPVPNASGYGTAKDKFNRATFDPVSIRSIRLQVRLQPEVSGGILEWRVE